jgi:hypothetical protein
MTDPDTSKTSPGVDESLTPSAAGGNLSDQLAELEAEAADLDSRRRNAKDAARDSRLHQAAQEITADLREFHNAINFRKPTATPPEEREGRERELVDELFSTIKERGIMVRISGPTGSIDLIDPAPLRERDELEIACKEITGRIERLREEHSVELEAERKAADAKRIKDALAGDDGDKIREALTPGGAPASGVFTTADLPSRQRVTTGG